MGKSGAYYSAPTGARRSPAYCMGRCGKRIVYGDRCPDCQRELRQRRKRKSR